MTVMRSALLILSLFPAFALGQAEDGEADGKVSNDQPGRPLQMPPASTEVKEAIDDFERFGRRGAWERALKALYTIPEEQTLRFVDGEDGFIIPVARKRRSVLTALPPEGQAAYRLFYDAEAKKLFEGAEGAVGAEGPRTRLLRLFRLVRRRQCRRSAGRPLLRARALRPRGRLLAGHPAGPPRHRSVARPDLAEGGPGPVPRGTPVRIRADPRRAGGPVRRRVGDRRGRDRVARRAPHAPPGRDGRGDGPGGAGAAPRRRGPGPRRPRWTPPGRSASPTRSRPA